MYIFIKTERFSCDPSFSKPEVCDIAVHAASQEQEKMTKVLVSQP